MQGFPFPFFPQNVTKKAPASRHFCLQGLCYSGDVGQGLCLFIGGGLLYKIKKWNLAGIISVAGIFSTFFGFMFGSFFGFEGTIIKPMWLSPMHAMMKLPFVGQLNTVINFLAVLYIHALTFVRRRHNFAILKAIGRTDSSIILPMLLTKIGQGIVVSIVAVFIVTLLCRLYLSEITKNIVLVDGWKSIALVLAFVLFIQIVAIFMDVIQLKRQRILRDLREE